VRAVAYAAIGAKQIPAPDSATRRDIINCFTNVLYDLTRRGVAVKIGHRPGARWKNSPRDSGLLKQMSKIIEKMLSDRVPLEKALANLLAAYQRHPSPQSARAIELIRTEIELRKRPT
jgi:hypothetical protein